MISVNRIRTLLHENQFVSNLLVELLTTGGGFATMSLSLSLTPGLTVPGSETGGSRAASVRRKHRAEGSPLSFASP